eukprot:TRINITY_DN174_c0_g3_i1.p1 TRINITY_DN174_c0_g3~~TRINITY_DN174_c0_g3_i1.p1  ORF type:complete len:1667 (-),score=524.24 TRINITY_DN174_c0_g3_i1:302-4738(-)
MIGIMELLLPVLVGGTIVCSTASESRSSCLSSAIRRSNTAFISETLVESLGNGGISSLSSSLLNSSELILDTIIEDDNTLIELLKKTKMISIFDSESMYAHPLIVEGSIVNGVEIKRIDTIDDNKKNTLIIKQTHHHLNESISNECMLPIPITTNVLIDVATNGMTHITGFISHSDIGETSQLPVILSPPSNEDEIWSANLAGELPVLDFPESGQGPKTLVPSSSSTGIAKLNIPNRVIAQLNDLGNKMNLGDSEGFNLSDLLIVIWGIMLHRHTQQDDVVIGVTPNRDFNSASVSPMKPRRQRSWSQLDRDDLFHNNNNDHDHNDNEYSQKNLLPFRMSFPEDCVTIDVLNEAFDRLLSIRSTSTALLKNDPLNLVQDVDYEYLKNFCANLNGSELRELIKTSVLDSTTLFNVKHNTPIPVIDSNVGLSLVIENNGSEGSFIGGIAHDRNRFDDECGERLALEFVLLIEEICKHSNEIIRKLYFTPPSELTTINNWNKASKHTFPSSRTMHNIISEKCKEFSGAIALRLSDKEFVTYRELDERTNFMANYLRTSLGIKKGTRVCICVPRSPLMVICDIAVMKAGGVYIPVDPAFPERLKFLVEDSASTVVMTIGKLGSQVKSMIADSVRILIADSKDMNGRDTKCPKVKVKSTDEAYSIYTSGSTGKPKGAVISHKSFVNLVYHHSRVIDIQPGELVGQFYGIMFDSTLAEVYPSLINGATVLFWDDDWTTTITKFKPDIIHCIPNQLASLNEKDCRFLRVVGVCGEPCNLSVVKEWGEHHLLVNGYGPTECTVFASEVVLKHTDTWVSIGGPLSNMHLYVVDKNMRQVPIGVPGELYIGGVGVGLGYWNRPELNAAKYVENIFDGGRMYGTGDLVRWRDIGELEFMGRLDRQVKIRGLRVELGEVENVLSTNGCGVTGCVVIVHKEQLVAYLTPDNVDTEELLKRAKKVLPKYEIPSIVITMDSFPLTPNCKVDTRSLPEPIFSSNEHFVAPTCPLEAMLCDMFGEILDREDVGIVDDFFELGGHSLAVVRLFANVRDNLQCSQLQVQDVFLHRTPQALSAFLADKVDPSLSRSNLATSKSDISQELSEQKYSVSSSNSQLVENPIQQLNTVKAGTPMFIVHPSGGMVWHLFGLANQLSVPCFGLQCTEEAPLDDLENMAKFYLSHIRQEQPIGPYVIGGYSFGAKVAVLMGMMLESEGELVKLVLLDGCLFKNGNVSKIAEKQDPRSQQGEPADAAIYLAVRHFVSEEVADETATAIHKMATKNLQHKLNFALDIISKRGDVEGLFGDFEMVKKIVTRMVIVFEGCVTMEAKYDCNTSFNGATLLLETEMHVDLSKTLEPSCNNLNRVFVDGEHLSMLDDDYLPPISKHIQSFLREPFTLPLIIHNSDDNSSTATTDVINEDMIIIEQEQQQQQEEEEPIKESSTSNVELPNTTTISQFPNNNNRDNYVLPFWFMILVAIFMIYFIILNTWNLLR